jgi:membrane-associated protease RseP (regulator of RpoE activity)
MRHIGAQVSCAESVNDTNPVGAGLARDSGVSGAGMLNVPPSSQASQLPQGERSLTKFVYDTSLVGAGLLAMNDNAVYAGSTLSSARFTASSASMMTC